MALEDFARVDDFGDAAAEARACRTDCALFDFSFLECARLEGKGAGGVIEAFTGRSVEALSEGKIIYALRVGPAGNAIADLTVWKTGAESFDVMSGRRKDIVDLLAYAGPGVDVIDMTAERATFAVQGPGSLDALRHVGDVGSIEPLRYFNFGCSNLAGVPCMIGRVGYTGEAGFEIIAPRRPIFGGRWRSMRRPPDSSRSTCSGSRRGLSCSPTNSGCRFLRAKLDWESSIARLIGPSRK
jgi:aminomethyltransferase